MSKATIVETWGPGVAIGRYLLLKPLARGGMAEIWLAQRSGPQGFSREVVIKRILSSEESSTDFERMFLDEARIVFACDVWKCRCGGRRRIVSLVTNRRTAEDMLRNMGMLDVAPPLPQAPGPPQLTLTPAPH